MSRFLAWLPSLVLMGIIYYLSSQPSFHTVGGYWEDFVVKKTAHFLEYSVLTISVCFSLFHSFFTSLTFTSVTRFIFSRYASSATSIIKRLIVVGGILTVFFAISDEIHQSYVPGREPRVRDVLIDTMGITTASWLIYRFKTSP